MGIATSPVLEPVKQNLWVVKNQHGLLLAAFTDRDHACAYVEAFDGAGFLARVARRLWRRLF